MNDDQIAKLKRIYGGRRDSHVARMLKCSVAEVQEQALLHCLSKDKAKFAGRKMPRWTLSDVAILKAEYPRCSNLALAVRLDRSVKSIVSKAHALGLKKDKDRLREMGRENVDRRWRRQ